MKMLCFGVIKMSRINIFTGHFGSGKTEIAINYAMKLAKEGKKGSFSRHRYCKSIFLLKKSKGGV